MKRKCDACVRERELRGGTWERSHFPSASCAEMNGVVPHTD